MKKVILIIIGTFVIGLSLIYLSIFFFQPSLVLDFYINPRGLEFSNSKEIFFEIRPFLANIQLTHTQKHKSHLFWSPNKKYIAFYERVMEPAENPFDKEWALKIINPRNFKIKTIFIGNSKTGQYQWLDDYTIRVYVNAGTGVRIYRDININILEPFIASMYMSPEFWTPVIKKR